MSECFGGPVNIATGLGALLRLCSRSRSRSRLRLRLRLLTQWYKTRIENNARRLVL